LDLDLNLHNNSLKNSVLELVNKVEIENILPFFVFDEVYSRFLTVIARGNAKVVSSLQKAKISESYGQEMIFELIENNILYIVNSREKPLKEYAKQLIKKEYKDYKIEPKLFFTKPFYRFWFSCVEPQRKNLVIDNKKVTESFAKYEGRLKSLVFEQISIELLKVKFSNDKIIEIASFWDRFSEFDIYATTKSGKKIVGECKYTNRPIIKSEIVKLIKKLEQSNLKSDYVALFSKSGFSHEIYKLKNNNILLFELEDFKKLLM